LRSFLAAVLVFSAAAARADITVQSEWVFPTRVGHTFELRPHERTRPLVVGDILYAANLEGRVLAFHRKDGYVLWETKIPAGVEGALAYGRSKLFVGDRAGNLKALNTRDGSESWSTYVGAEWLSPPVLLRDRLYAMASSEELVALSADDGKILWRYSHRGDEKMTIRGTSSPTVSGSDVFVGFSDGSLVALSAESGTELWVKKLRVRERFYDVDMPPLADETSVYAASFDGMLYRLDRKTGETKWNFPVGSYGGFVLEEGRLYFSGLNGNLYAIDANSGQSIWKVPFDSAVALAPTKVGNTLVVTTSGDPFYVLDPKDGRLLYIGRLGVGTLAPAISGGDEWFYCISNYGNLYAFSVTERAFPIRKELRTVGLPSALSRENWP
jgi:outer membrane protein assembly factor BamB